MIMEQEGALKGFAAGLLMPSATKATKAGDLDAWPCPLLQLFWKLHLTIHAMTWYMEHKETIKNSPAAQAFCSIFIQPFRLNPEHIQL